MMARRHRKGGGKYSMHGKRQMMPELTRLECLSA
jgi:hypothetical protein